MFKVMTGIDVRHEPYPSDPQALTDLLGGKVQVQFSGLGAAIEYIRTGKLRALAVTAATRSQALPDVPTAGEFVTGYEASSWFGVGAPRNTPAEVVDRLNKAINGSLADAKTKARCGHAAAAPPSSVAKNFRRAM